MASIISVDPFRCRMWDLHDRLEQNLDESNCRSEIDSISKHGQLIPALGRPLRDERNYEVELIYGARRLFIAQHLKRPLFVEVREISDAEAIIAMDIENRHRVDISPYERGRSYLKWLRGGFFKSQDELARSLHISSSQVSRLIKAATLPAVIMAAFKSPADICETWALELAAALTDADRHRTICAKARSIASATTRPSAREIYRQLLAAAAPGRKAKAKPRDEVVTDRNNRPLFRIRHQSSAVALILPIDKISAGTLEDVRSVVRGVLLSLPASGHASHLRHDSAPTEPVSQARLLAGADARD